MRPVDVDQAEVRIEVGQADAIRIDFVGEADSGFREITARCVEATRCDFVERIVVLLRIRDPEPLTASLSLTARADMGCGNISRFVERI